PWESLNPGDRVLIHWRANAYHEKWVICRRGTAENPIVISGVPGPDGSLPVIDGRNATTRLDLNFWNEVRGVVKIGGANTPPDTLPAHIVIENLEIRSGRPPFSFTNASGSVENYVNNAAAIYVEKAENLIIRNCTLHDAGNGLFIGAHDGDTQNILIEANWIHSNGIENRIYEHNTYTAAINITYQFNRFGRLREDCGGNNLKDRSAGLVVRYNWIEDGNRQLDLVDAEDSSVLVNHPSYHTTFVYGNVLIESDGEGNSQMVHYGGDSGTIADYRKGTLYFFNNTVVSTRSGNTTLMRLSTNDEHADVRNNIIYPTADGSRMAMLSGSGVMDLLNNWLPTDWVTSHSSSFDGTLIQGINLEGTEPSFLDVSTQDYSLVNGSVCINSGGPLHTDVLPDHDVDWQYVLHQSAEARPVVDQLDLGAFEAGFIFADGFESGSTFAWSSTHP
ncbi:MAG: polysaccharide-degrading enzyme, partial [bacterium]|nr:polysaccharide-degrading enzyme [bacterium]